MLEFINSKLWRKTCCGRCSCWTLSSGTENWSYQRHLEHPKPWQLIASRNHSLVEQTESKGNSTACKARNCLQVQVDFWPYNEQHVTVRNKTFICLGSRKDCLYEINLDGKWKALNTVADISWHLVQNKSLQIQSATNFIWTNIIIQVFNQLNYFS